MSDPTMDLMVRAVVARQLQVPPDDVTADLDLYECMIDDEQAVALLAEMGRALDVRFPDDFLDGLHTYADLTTAVRVSLS
ncbi:acyl carrier protein [Spongisporangium articulatum]|uniref:Acyl carrier protein n=1 Tax=Spongisporangium articulatum TaxID=3362603 RepID=A0ABW8AMK5_9ACTN